MREFETHGSAIYESPLGGLRLTVSDAGALERLELPGPEDRIGGEGVRSITDPLFRSVVEQLDGYFRGTRTTFSLPLAPRGTAFETEVWAALQQIGFGETWSYRRLAEAVGRPSAARAVGGANGRNPIPIIIPCHRVIGSDGTLTGYGGGLPIKEWLLRHEGWRGTPSPRGRSSEVQGRFDGLDGP